LATDESEELLPVNQLRSLFTAKKYWRWLTDSASDSILDIGALQICIRICIYICICFCFCICISIDNNGEWWNIV